MKSTDNSTTREIRELRSDETDEFISLMQIAFKDSIEEDRLDEEEIRKLMKKVRTPAGRILTRAIGMRIEFYVIEVDDSIASGILLNINKNEVHVGDLMTHPNNRRQGLARRLLRFTFDRARELGVDIVTLGARADNVDAVSLYNSEGFETTYRVGRFDTDLEKGMPKAASNDLILAGVTKIRYEDADAMLDDCFPASHLEVQGREKFVKDQIPSRALRFFARRLGGQTINTYAFFVKGEEKLHGYVQASQSRVEDRISLSSPVLLEKDNDLLLEVIPRVLKIESAIRGLTTASVNCSMHRTDAITKIESLGFKKNRESISMRKRF